MKPKLFVFVLGLIVGLLIALAVPPLLNTVLPEGLTRGKSATTGQVVAKRLQEDRLLLTIESEQGAVLATFTQRVPEIDLLVEEGDRVTLGTTSYEPFVQDPKILGVNKGAEDTAEDAEPREPAPAVDGEPEPSPPEAADEPAAEEPAGGEPDQPAEEENQQGSEPEPADTPIEAEGSEPPPKEGEEPPRP